LNDARKRLLAENGRLIPEQDVLWAALVEAPDTYERILAPWKSVAGIDLEAALPVVLNTMYKRQCKPEQLVSDAQPWHVLDYPNGAEPRAEKALRFVVSRSGTIHGFAMWFETKLFQEVGFTTAPGGKESVYGQVFLPLLAPVEVVAGEEICAGLYADLVGSDYVWRWEFEPAGKRGRQTVKYLQSTFQGGGLTTASLRKRSAEFVPVLSEAGL